MIAITKYISETFSDVSPKTITDDSEMIRVAILGEIDAINLYSQIAGRIKNESAKKILLDIAKEEKVHVGELNRLLELLDPEELSAQREGHQEASKKIK